MKYTEEVKRILATGEVKITKDRLEKFISMVSPFLKDFSSRLNISYINGHDLCAFNLNLECTEDVMKCLHFLNSWGDIQGFNAEIYSDYEDDVSERIYSDNNIFYKSDAVIETYYAECEDDQSYYDDFYQLILINEEISREDTYDCSISDLTSDMFYRAAIKSNSLNELKTNLVKEYGKFIDFEDDSFRISIYFVRDDNSFEGQTQILIRPTADNLGLAFDIDATLKYFKNYQPISFEGTVYPDFEEVTNSTTFSDNGIQTKWDIFKNDDYHLVNLGVEHARKLFIVPEMKVKVTFNGEWVSPCTVCIKRLENMLNGCKTCQFETVQEDEIRLESV